MSSVNDVNSIPTEGKNLIIVANVQDVLHFRAFAADGKRVVDTDESQMPDKAPQIAKLKSLPSDLWGVPKLPQSDKARVISAARSIVGHTLQYLAEKRIQDLVGVPCLTCHHSASPDTPEECPLLEGIKREDDCPPYREQILAVTMANIRDLSQYAIMASPNTITLYEGISLLINTFLKSQDGGALLTTYKYIANLISKRMCQLIVTTSLDDSLESALRESNINIKLERIFFDPYWKDRSEYRGAFVHKTLRKLEEVKPESRLPENHAIILKLCGTYEHKGAQPFLLTSEHVNRLVDCMNKLPTIISDKLKNETTLFIGHSPNDPELQRVLEAIIGSLGHNKFKGKSYFIHQCKPGFLDEDFYKQHFASIRFVGLRDELERIIEALGT